MFDLKEKILYHSLREIDAVVSYQTANDEVTVPAVHFVESSAGDNVVVLEIEQSSRIDLSRIDFAELVNDRRQVLHLNAALFLKLLDRRRNFEVRRNVEHGGRRKLGINDGFAIGHRARKRVPAGGDVAANLIEAVLGGSGKLVRSARRDARQQGNKDGGGESQPAT